MLHHVLLDLGLALGVDAHQVLHWLLSNVEVFGGLLHCQSKADLGFLELVHGDEVSFHNQFLTPVDAFLKTFSKLINEQSELVLLLQDVVIDSFKEIHVFGQFRIVGNSLDEVPTVFEQELRGVHELGHVLLQKLPRFEHLQHIAETVETLLVVQGLHIGHEVVDQFLLIGTHEVLVILDQFGPGFAHEHVDVLAVHPLERDRVGGVQQVEVGLGQERVIHLEFIVVQVDEERVVDTQDQVLPGELVYDDLVVLFFSS